MTKFSVSVLILLSLAFAGPASAHDEIESSQPLPGATIEAGVIPVRLTFGEAPMDLPFGQGNLIAVARVSDGEQLGPACARVEGNMLTTNLQLSADGEYKVLWRVVSNDGHVVTGDFNIKIENHSYYSTDNPGNQCFDENGNELAMDTQEPLSKKVEPWQRLLFDLLWALAFVIPATLAGAILVKRRQRI